MAQTTQIIYCPWETFPVAIWFKSLASFACDEQIIFAWFFLDGEKEIESNRWRCFEKKNLIQEIWMDYS